MSVEIFLLNYFQPSEIYVKVNNYGELFKQVFTTRNKPRRSFIEGLRNKRGLNLASLQQFVQSQNEIDKIVTHVKIGRYGKFLELPLTFQLSLDWFYIAELIRTDGHISKNLDRVKLTNNDKTLLLKFGAFCESLGITYIRKESDRYLVFNSTLTKILNKVFEIQNGNKSLRVYLPEWIKKVDNRELSSCLRGAFDGDGGVQNGSDGTRRVRLTTGSKQYAGDIHECLAKFAIKSSVFKDPRLGKNVWYVEIPDKLSLIRFKENIGFNQIKRADKLQSLLSSYTSHPLNELEVIIYELLQTTDKFTITQLSRLLNKSPTTISEQITKLEKSGKIRTERIGNRRFVYSS